MQYEKAWNCQIDGVASRRMGSIWVESLGHAFELALDLLAAAVRDCTDALWESPMWPVPTPPPDQQFLGADSKPITDPERLVTLARRLVERRSTPWSVAWHALECLDYDLSGDFSPWAPPAPFTAYAHWRDLPSMEVAWSRPELLAYIEYSRRRQHGVLAQLTDEQAASPLPGTHRYAGQPYARLLAGIPAHTTEHAAQIRQFITDPATRPQQ